MSFSSPRSHNEVQLSRTMLLDLLADLQARTFQAFGCQIRLFIHGGAVMILHPSLSTSSTRRTTRDIDYIKRAFGHEWRKKGVYGAEDRLQACIDATAHKFQIGTDWMNADPDVALPFARDPKGHIYDPIYYDSKQPNNVEMNTVYSSPGLLIISVTMFWGVALKLVRYKKEDPTDIVAMLRHGTKLNGVQWTPRIMETWVKTLCWPMGYNDYQPQRIEELKGRIQDAVRLLQNSSDEFLPGSNEHSHALVPRSSSHSMRDAALVSPQGHAHMHTPIHMQPFANFPDVHSASHAPPTHQHSFQSPTAGPFRMPEPWISPSNMMMRPQHPQTRAF
ncbi:hypothetical protein HYDPIDRAFT_114573 [Hydnomerulius pinastri MD-312]|uniref:Unplaced genomic scaffold scaffold_21, whole genome shotgun sequence n=1 Tax=Hydnomerulius pinastri MD-312 TaxID=994086 RepID=A0A0C9VWA4_9AGAM|nr:hypothetical protein HYDPIDRAFT_114573 [Hydnomerulius pinastri MD-312]